MRGLRRMEGGQRLRAERFGVGLRDVPSRTVGDDQAVDQPDRPRAPGGELGLGDVVVCAKAPAGIASAATTIAVVTEFFSVMVMSSRLPEQRHPLQDKPRTKSPPCLFASLNNSFVLPQS